MARQPLDGNQTHDRDLEQRITNFLRLHRVPGGRSIRAHARQGVVTLKGIVASFYYRQLCTHACHRVAGVRSIVDEIEVVDHRPAAIAG